MLNAIYQFIRNRKANQLLTRIAQGEPTWVVRTTDPTDKKMLDYIMHRLRVYAQEKMAYELSRPGVAEGKPPAQSVNPPVFSPLLLECLAWLAHDSLAFYAQLWLMGEIELTQLRQKVAAIETVLSDHQAMADDYRHQYETVVRLTREAERIVQVATTINESMQPQKRMN